MKNPRIQLILQAGIEHQKAGRMDEAREAYSTASRAAPDLFDPWYLGGTAAYYQGKLQDAESLLRHARGIDAHSTTAKLFLGMVLCDLGNYAESVPLLRVAVLAHPQFPEAWTGLAEGLMATGRAPEAVLCYQRLAAMQPQNAVVHERLGHALHASSALVEAETAFRRAIELDPDFSQAWVNLGFALLDAPDRFREAEVCFRVGSADSSLAERVGAGLAAVAAKSCQEPAAV